MSVGTPRPHGLGVVVIVEDEYLEAHADEVEGVVTDVNLAGEMSGLELARHASSHRPWRHLLLASGVAQPAADAIPPNATFIQRPWRAKQLEAFIG